MSIASVGAAYDRGVAAPARGLLVLEEATEDVRLESIGLALLLKAMAMAEAGRLVFSAPLGDDVPDILGLSSGLMR